MSRDLRNVPPSGALGVVCVCVGGGGGWVFTAQLNEYVELLSRNPKSSESQYIIVLNPGYFLAEDVGKLLEIKVCHILVVI